MPDAAPPPRYTPAEADRPAALLARHPAGTLSNPAVLACILQQADTALAESVLARFPTWDHLARASLAELTAIPGVGPARAAAVRAACHLAERLPRELRETAPVLDNPETVAELLAEETRVLEVELFKVVLLNTRRRLIEIVNVTQGTLDTLLVHPREVFTAAIQRQAAALILVHNHPSGDPQPSDADIKVTRDLIRAGQLLRIEVLDHVILGRRSAERPVKFWSSLRELGYFFA